jgi:hypothetical protein
MKAAQSHLRLEWRERRRPMFAGAVPSLSTRSKAAIATSAGLAGVTGLVAPIVLYDWFNAGHTALELPMAATSWAFGLDHFAQNGYLWGSIVVGALLLVGYGVLHGIVFGAIADRFLMLQTLPETLGAGIAWGFVSWLFFWYTLLPITRGGAPFRLIGPSSLFVSPTWVFVVGFAVLGVSTALGYRFTRRA